MDEMRRREIEERLNQITPGSWFWSFTYEGDFIVETRLLSDTPLDNVLFFRSDVKAQSDENLSFIANAPDYVRDLLNYIENLEGEIINLKLKQRNIMKVFNRWNMEISTVENEYWEENVSGAISDARLITKGYSEGVLGYDIFTEEE